MIELFNNGYVILENKSPYYGLIISHGILSNNILQSYQNISFLTEIGIGIGDSSIKELVEMGYTNIDQIKNNYKEFRKGLKNPLNKYFKGHISTNLTKEEATKWVIYFNKIIKNIDKNIIFNIAGSYARGEDIIGDIDYVIVSKSDISLWNTMFKLYNRLSSIYTNDISFDTALQYPKKYTNKKYYSTNIKILFKTKKGIIKVEIYGYSKCKFIYPYFSRTANTELQKKIKLYASKKNILLSPWGLIDKNTNDIVKGSEYIKNIEDLYTFLNYSEEPFIIGNPNGSELIASFDLDWTIIKPISGNKFPKNYDDWILIPNIKQLINKLYNNGYKIVIFTNQASLYFDIDKFKHKIHKIINEIGIPNSSVWIYWIWTLQKT